jgi:hypothetical protein
VSAQDSEGRPAGDVGAAAAGGGTGQAATGIETTRVEGVPAPLPTDDVAAVAAVGVGDDPSSGGGSKSIAESLPVGSELAQEKPEVLLAGAFVGAFLFARILKHITSG